MGFVQQVQPDAWMNDVAKKQRLRKGAWKAPIVSNKWVGGARGSNTGGCPLMDF